MRTSIVALALVALAAAPAAAQPCGVPGFTYAAFGDRAVSMRGGATTDSYDSSAGSYAATRASASGDLGTNATSAGSVRLMGSTTRVDGTIDVGFGGTPGSVISTSGGASYAASGARSAALALTPVSIPVVGAYQGNVNVSAGATTVLAPDQTYGAVGVAGNSTLVLSPGTYVFDSLAIAGNSRLSVPAGPVVVYVKTDLDFAGGTVVNGSQKATDLVFFGAPTLTNVQVSGGASAAYAVYAPAADITVRGGADVFGSLVGRTIDNAGGSAIHYDRALGAYAGGPFTCALEVSRATPIVATLGGQDAVVQGTFELPLPSRTRIDSVADVAAFRFPHTTGHVRARTAASISTTATEFAAGTVLFDAATRIPPASTAGCAGFDGTCRNVFTVTQPPAATGISLRPPRVPFTDANANTIGALIAPPASVPGIGPAHWRTIVREVLRGRLGGVDRSTVAVIGASPLAGSPARPTIVYVGSTDGMLHAICASVGPGCPALGVELWAFMPRVQLPLVRTNTTRLDGSARVVDAFGDFAGTGQRSFRTVLAFQTGSAPGAVYALDVTDPTNPVVLWEFTAPAAASPYELGVGLALAAGPTLVADSPKNLVIAQTSNGGTAGPGVVATALALETGEPQWKFGYAYPSPPRGIAADLPLPDKGIPGGAVGVDLLRQGFTTDIVMGDLYGNLWRLDAATGTSTTGAGVPLFSFSTNKRPIGALPAIYSNGNQQFAVFGSGGYADPLVATWSAGRQSLIAIALASAGPYPIAETSPALALKEDLAPGENVFAQVLVVGSELFLATDTSDVNLAAYGTGGNTGRVLAYDLTTGTAAPAVVVRGGAGALANAGTALYSSSSDQQQELATGAASTTGEGVDSATLPSLARRLWLRLE